MGAGCSGAKATNAITPSNLNEEAHAHLKDLQGNDIRAPTPSKDQMNSTLGRTQPKVGDEATVDDRCHDKEGTNRSHEQLWQAVQNDDTNAAAKYLDKLADKGGNFGENDLMDNAGQSMLHKAASHGYAEMLMLLLERSGSKPDLVNGQLATPLHLACRTDRESVVKFLIGCGVDVNTQDEHGQTPLLVCCIHGHKNLASFLIESSIAGHLPEALDVDVKDHRGLTALNCAAIKGELELCKTLVSRGGAAVNQSSPKGCTPLIYAARGGYSKVVQFLLEKKASPLKQDHAGGTVLHHAIEKGHIEVLEIMLAHGIDVYSAIEIADNAGRTPLFEAVENMENPCLLVNEGEEVEEADRTRLVKMLVKSRKQGGFGAKPNVVNFNGQTPLFAAVREGCLETVKILIEAGAKGDLNSGELVKVEEGEEADDEEFDSLEEKYFMEAFKNCMTPLHVATVLGYDEIAVYLIQNAQANVNLQSNRAKYTSMHLAVLANKPEMIIELLTKAPADPMLEDSQGQSLLDMVYKYIPSYVESFQALLENLQLHRLNSASGQSDGANIARHYVDPDDERALKGVADPNAALNMFEQQNQIDALGVQVEANADGTEAGPNAKSQLADVEESEIELPEGVQMDMRIESVFGRKIALAMLSLNWKYKEMAIKVAYKQVEKSLAKQDTTNLDLIGLIEAATASVGSCCKEKVIKVFNVALALFNHMVSSSKIDQDNSLMQKFYQTIEKEQIVPQLLKKSEESNTRITNKIHEALLDLSYHPKVGEDFVAKALIEQIQTHFSQKSSNYKGLLAQLALLFKMINSFGLANAEKGSTGTVMTSELVIKTAVAAIGHANKDVKNAAIKILVDVQRLSGSVQETDLQNLNDKTKEMVWDKVCSTEVEKNQELVLNRTLKGIQPVSLNVVNLDPFAGGINDREEDEGKMGSSEQQAINKEKFDSLKALITEKGAHKDWTQREIALNSLQELFEIANVRDLTDEQEFLTNCTVLLKQCLEENNIQIYLLAVQAAAVFFSKALWFDVVLESMQVLLKAIILRTADTNTRVRKKSVDVINQVWEANPQSSNATSVLGKKPGNAAKSDLISATIAEIICDNTLQEKSIVGRIGLLIKRALVIESEEDLSKRSHQVIFGKDYEQLTEFACQWCSHKNTKVRQSALKLIVEMCRVNLIDPRGGPFKQRIINFILGLRPSLRDPLVTKINEVCKQMQLENSSPTSKNQQPYINVEELELNVATKQRATSMDVRQGMRGAATRQSQQSQNKENKDGGSDWAKLPNIGGSLNLPNVASTQQTPKEGGAQGQTIVLPFSQPITEEQKENNKDFIELFGEAIMTCTLSTTWSCRQAAIQKIVEQLHNLDPQRRDAMFGEINRQNMPVELTFKTFLNYCKESLNDPVLKNYILTLDLVQRALPIFFRNVSNEQLKTALMPLVSVVLKKTSDLKQKLRESSMTFCLYLAHQSPIGPQIMVNQVLIELKAIQAPDKKPKTEDKEATKNSAAANYGNSHMIASCLKLLQQYQIQTKIVEVKTKGVIFEQFMENINLALKHQNPQVRKEAEALFKVLYQDFGETLAKSLVNQKPALTQKLLADAKSESLSNNLNSNQTQSAKPGIGSSGDKNEAKKANDQFNVNRASNQIKEDFLNESTVLNLLNGKKELLDQLRLPNVKKRQVAIVEIKKIVQSKISQVNSSTARDLFEPISLLMRQLLTDDAAEVYLEALNLLKYVVGSLAPHLSSLDLHLMMGSFIGLIVNNTVSGNMRIRVASDKVIVFFAKHQSIGSYIIAKEVLKNIERINKNLAVQIVSTAGLGPDKQEIIDEVAGRKEILCRFYSILNLLLQQFSIVLCYQPDFYAKSLDLIAETMGFCQDEALIKNGCSTIIISLFQIDPKLLDQGVSKLEVSKKSHIRKVMIEFENLNQKTKGLQVNQTGTHGGSLAMSGDRLSSPNASFRDTQQSFTSISTSGAGAPPVSPFDRRQGSRGQNESGSEWNSGGGIGRRQRNSEVRQTGNKMGDNFRSLEQPPNMIMDEMAGGTGTEWMQNQNRRRRGEEKSEFALPDIDTTPGRKRSIQATNTGAKQYGAAGFKKSEVIDRVGNNKPPAFGQGIMQGGGGGMGSEGMSSTAYSGAPGTGYTPSIAALSNQRQNQTNTMMGSSPGKRRASQQRFNPAGSSSGYDPSQSSAAQAQKGADGPNRPPLYVPGHRDGAMGGAGGAGFNPVSSSITSQQMKSELSWDSKPTPSLAAQHNAAILGTKRPSFEYGEKERTRFGSNSRDKPQQSSPANSRFGMQPQPLKESVMKQAVTSTVNAKPPMQGGMKKTSAPPVATFAFKAQTATYKESESKKQYKPDIFNDDE